MLQKVKHHLDGDAQHEAEEQLVLLEQAAADIAVQRVCDVCHQVADPCRQCI